MLRGIKMLLNGVEWVKYRGALIPNITPHTHVVLNPENIDWLLRKSNAYFLHWISDFDTHNESKFWYVIKDNPVSLEELSKKTRYQIRRALKHCRVERTDAAYIADAGYLIHKKAFDGYDTASGLLDQTFFASCTARKANDPSWEFWGVWNQDGTLIAYSQNKIRENTCTYSTVDIDPEYRNLTPGYALFFTMNTYYLNEKKFLYVNDGARSINHTSNIQEFLITKLKFRKAYCRFNIKYNLKIKLLVALLYPIRRIIGIIDVNSTRKLSTLLKLEEIRKSFANI